MSLLLLITTLDVDGRQNNREHHVIRLLGARYDRVILVYRRRAPAGRRATALRAGTTAVWTEGHVTHVAVDPALNPPEGALRGRTTAAPGAGALRRWAGRVVDTAAIARDLATMAALTAAARQAVAGTPPQDIACEAIGPWAAEAARRLRAEGRIAAYAYVDRDFEPGFVSSAPRRAWAGGMERRAARQADLTFCAGERLAARLRPLAGGRLHLSPTGVDAGRIAARHRLRAVPHLAYLGEVAPWACMEEALAALVLLPQARLSVRGPALPGYRDHLLAEAGRLGVAGRLDWPGECPRAEALALLNFAGIGLAVFRPTPLRIHAAPLKVMEYMAAGLPALAPEGTEAGDILARSGAGATCRAAPEAIARAVTAMLADPVGYAAMSAAGPAAAAARDWDRVMAAEFALLCGLNAPRGQPLRDGLPRLHPAGAP